MIVDGKAIARELLATLQTRRVGIARPVTLGIAIAPGNPVIESFVAIKQSVAAQLDVRMVRTEISATTESGIEAVRSLKFNPEIDGIIVQLPLPEGVDINAVLAELPREKDVDAMSTASDHAVEAPVVLAVDEILARHGIEIPGAHVVVVGNGRLVGAPVSKHLRRRGANVETVTLEQGTLDALKSADIVILGAGHPGLVKKEHLKEGVVLIDAGTTEQGGKVRGDADPSCAEVASVFVPVPGGVGPIAVHMIFKNLFDLIESASHR